MLKVCLMGVSAAIKGEVKRGMGLCVSGLWWFSLQWSGKTSVGNLSFSQSCRDYSYNVYNICISFSISSKWKLKQKAPTVSLPDHRLSLSLSLSSLIVRHPLSCLQPSFQEIKPVSYHFPALKASVTPHSTQPLDQDIKVFPCGHISSSILYPLLVRQAACWSPSPSCLTHSSFRNALLPLETPAFFTVDLKWFPFPWSFFWSLLAPHTPPPWEKSS